MQSSAMGWELLLYLGLMVLGLVSFVVVLLLLRRWMLGTRSSLLRENFSIHQLRELHRQGALSDEEYERAKKLVLAQALIDDAPPSDDPV